MRTEEKTEIQKKRILEKIEKTLGRKVGHFELAELRGTAETLNKLGIYPKSGMGTAWGLLLFCDGEACDGCRVYFYYPATEGMFDFFFRQNSGDAPAEDQFACLNDFEPLAFELAKKSLLSFFNPDEKRTIFATAKAGDSELKFCLILMENKAADVAERLEKALPRKE